ncbi:hypothetical protein JDV02_010686 [Purpureocillium takamizusanense]|uniref:Hydrophobin n=1 Tax=Purpureocillium takamizusanense TaxID=2060973 RepID=A0A9Q8QR37_9HYPO|nr:uncharacterized protein JDV02_010686 [Purpureocillium takamizusanense]UNI24973.1 hypothetical protein JDV02_010686 [Purpureocillium takamizusanense]
MRFSAFISALALGAAAAASPTEVTAREIRARDNCNQSGKNVVCCNGPLSCLLNLLGGPCGGDSYCCDNGATSGNGAIVFSCQNLDFL